MRRRRSTRAAGAFTAAALALAVTLPAEAGPTRPTPRPAADERYRITGRPAADGCGGRIVLAARHLRFGARTLFADVVDRTYALERRGRRRIAEGRFEDDYACPGTRIRG